MHKMSIQNKIAMKQIPNPYAHPTLELIHTRKVTPKIPPMVKLSKNKLKKVESLAASFGSFSSNWSAPRDGRAAFTPLVPNATRYRPRYSIAT
jgi:hypothetical protein